VPLARPFAAAALLAAAALASGHAHAQVAVERRDGAALRVSPGQSATAVFRVSNAGVKGVVVQPRAALPRGWAPVAPEGDVELAPGARAVRLVGFAVPRDARAGSYFVKLSVRSPADRPPGSDSVRVVVAERHALAVRVAEAPRFAVAGEPYVARFAIENRGNAPEAVALRLASSHGVEARIDSARVTLAPGEARTVSVRVSTPRASSASLPHRLEVRARSTGDSAATASAASVVDIVGRGGSGAARARFPVEVRIRSGAGGSPVPAVSGSGTLVRGGTSRVDFLFRPADAQGSLLGDPAEYRLRFTARGVDVRLGDGVYALSPLTQPGRFGAGAGGTVAKGRVEAGGFVVRDRSVPGEERGGHARLGMGGIGSLGAHYLSRTGRDAGTLASARLQLAPLRQLALDAELGSGSGPAGSGAAHSVLLTGSAARATLFIRHMMAGVAYPAPFAGERMDEAGLTLRPAGALHLTGTAVRFRDDTPLSAFAGASSRDLLAGSIGYGSLLAAEYRQERRGDDELTETVALRGTYRAGPLWFSPRAEVGTVEGPLATAPFRRLAAHGGVNFRRQSLSGWVEHSTRDALFPDRAALLASLFATLRPTTATRIQATLQASRGGGPWRTGNAELGVWQDLPRGHRVVARARWAGAGADGGPRLLLDYVIPVGVPVARGGETGRVAGRIFDAESGRGVTGVPVRLGRQVVLTDQRGAWSFDGIAPGTHPLEIDRLAAGLERVPLRPVPAEVQVRGGRTARVDVSLVHATRLRGTIRVFDFVEGAAPGSGPPPTVESGGLRDAVVVLASADETHRRVTDAAGRFEVADLRPGRWTLAVERAELPAHHRLERDSLVLDVAGGAAPEVTLRVLPRFRPVRIIAGGEVRAGAAPVAATPPVTAPRVAPAPVAAAPRTPERPAVPAPPATPPVASATPARAAALAPRPAPPAATRTPAPRAEVGSSGFSDWPHTTYTVQPGDRSLVDIAFLTYRDGAFWPRLWLANRHILSSRDRIVPGQVLIVPAPGPLTREEIAVRRQYQARMR
jgi:hypothetical protein